MIMYNAYTIIYATTKTQHVHTVDKTSETVLQHFFTLLMYAVPGMCQLGSYYFRI